jgi:hypothetical protein
MCDDSQETVRVLQVLDDFEASHDIEDSEACVQSRCVGYSEAEIGGLIGLARMFDDGRRVIDSNHVVRMLGKQRRAITLPASDIEDPEPLHKWRRELVTGLMPGEESRIAPWHDTLLIDPIE